MATKKVKIHRHTRRSPTGKIHTVKPHRRKIRTLGKKITYKKVGTFMVGHDEKGNFRGSRVVPLTKPLKIKNPSKVPKKSNKATSKRKIRKTKKPKVRKARRARNGKINISTIDTKFFNNEITEEQWLNSRKKLMGLN